MLPYTTKKWTNHARIKTNICSHFRHLTHLSSNDQFLCVPDNKMREKLYDCSLATAAEKKNPAWATSQKENYCDNYFKPT